ncbi:hypothetical protein [Lachnoclostridium sp. Marseille-P6806]|uniref:hypothetical protein n=1 Tax=Lachnoclostridium sp. Marseille-P6806 TaxID=2364793 RepID=UPI001030933C|nr:hypothetical protein [Lachnoclostridium sp. Marseille-P6806]
MTDEKLDQILKQALAPEIEDSEIQIRGKAGKHTMRIKKVIAGGVAACAALTLVAAGGYFGSAGGYFGGFLKREGNEPVSGANEQKVSVGNLFAVTAYAADLPEGISSGDVVGLNTASATYGSSKYLDNRFAISGQNIEKIKITTDKCRLYSVTSVYEGDADYEEAQSGEMSGSDEYVRITDAGPDYDEETAAEPAPYHYEHLVVAGNTYEGAYHDDIMFGMSVPEELWSTNDDMQAAFHEDIDQVNGAILTMEVTFSDGSTETHHYRLNTGKIFVPADRDGYLQWDKLTRFITAEEEKAETCYVYGYLMEKID